MGGSAGYIRLERNCTAGALTVRYVVEDGSTARNDRDFDYLPRTATTAQAPLSPVPLRDASRPWQPVLLATIPSAGPLPAQVDTRPLPIAASGPCVSFHITESVK